MRQLIERLKGEGRTIFLCTHNLEEAESLCDRIAVFRTRLVALDTSANLRGRLFQRQVVVEMERADERVVDAVRDLGFVRSAQQDGSTLVVEMTEPDSNRPALVECIVDTGGRIQSVFERRHSLEEVYLALLEEERTSGTGG